MAVDHWGQPAICTRLCLCVLQKARLARIKLAKASSGVAFANKKKASEARLAAQEAGLDIEGHKEDDIFEMQHHHLLRCLEKTTVRGAGTGTHPHKPGDAMHY